MTTRSPYTVTAGHRCKVCGTVERVSKRAQEPVAERLIREAEAHRLEAVTEYLTESESDWRMGRDAQGRQRLERWNADTQMIDTVDIEAAIAVVKSVSEGASAPGSRDLPDGQALDRSQPSETEPCDCGWVGKDIAKHRARSAAHAGTIGPTGESGD